MNRINSSVRLPPDLKDTCGNKPRGKNEFYLFDFFFYYHQIIFLHYFKSTKTTLTLNKGP